MYKAGDKLIHPTYGLGTVESIEDKDLLGDLVTMATVFFPEEGLRMMLNCNQEESLLRPVIKPAQVKEVLQALRQSAGEGPNRSAWRQRVNLEKLKSNDLFETVQVIKNLALVRHRKKKLNERETTMLERSTRILVDELAFVSDRPREQLEAEVVAASLDVPEQKAAG